MNIVGFNPTDLFEEYTTLYKERYGDQGPSISSCINEHPYNPGCGCWKCSLIALRAWKQKQDIDTDNIKGPHENT